MWNLVIVASQVFDDAVQAEHQGKPCMIDLLPGRTSEGLLDMLDHLTLCSCYFAICRLNSMKESQIL